MKALLSGFSWGPSIGKPRTTAKSVKSCLEGLAGLSLQRGMRMGVRFLIVTRSWSDRRSDMGSMCFGLPRNAESSSYAPNYVLLSEPNNAPQH